MWLFYSMRNGYIPNGSDGMMNIPNNMSMKKIQKLADNFLHGRAGYVYLMPNWTQAMSELSPIRFEEYIHDHGTIVARKG